MHQPTPALFSDGDGATFLTAPVERIVRRAQVRIAIDTASRNLILANLAVALMVAGTSYSSQHGFVLNQRTAAWAICTCALFCFGLSLTRRLLLEGEMQEVVQQRLLSAADQPMPSRQATVDRVTGHSATSRTASTEASVQPAPVRLQTNALSNPDTSRALQSMKIFMAVSGMAWGSATWLLMPTAVPGQEVFLLASLPIAMAGGAGGVAVCRPLIRVFVYALSAVLVTGLLRLGSMEHAIFCLLFLLFAGAIIIHSADQEAAVAKSLRLSLVNESLLAKRTEQQQEALRAREQAEQAQALAEKADRAKTTFIASTSHDLRQPLHALVQYVAHLKRQPEDGRSGLVVDKVEESIAAMSGLLNAVLDFSKVSMGSVRPVLTSVDIIALLRRLESQVADKAWAKGLLLQFQSQPGHVKTDPALLERVLGNLIHNAIRYTNQGRVVVRTKQRAEVLRVLVSDSGIGIAANEKDRIFEAYYQVDNTARDRSKGMGLGLAIVHDLSVLLNIRVRVKSRPGVGSTFVLDIPRGEPALVQPAASAQPTLPDCVRGALVLLVDDDPMARDALALTLTDFGCRVVAATSAEHALQELAAMEFVPQLMLCDYRLQNGTTGLDVIAAVVARQKSLCGDAFELPALVVSGDTSPDELAHVAAAGYRMLHKPVPPDVFYAALNEALGRIMTGAHG